MKISAKLIMDAMNSITKTIAKHDASILTGLGIITGVMVVPMTIKATRKNDVEIKKAKTTKEKVIVTAKNYAPVVGMSLASTACIIASRRASIKKEAALTAAYELSRKGYEEYRNKVKDSLGSETDKKILGDISQDKINANPPTGLNVIDTGKGDTLFYDSLSGRYFKSSVPAVKMAEADLYREVLELTFVNCNDWYYLIGLEDIDFGKDSGWDYSHPMKLILNSRLTPDSEPCVVLDYPQEPSSKYLGMFA